MFRQAARCTVAVTVAVTGVGHLANAHSWYPRECCHEIDCAPVDTAIWVTPAGGGPSQLHVTSKHGKAVIPRGFSTRDSKDSRMHICMGYDEFGNPAVLCFFVPPSM